MTKPLFHVLSERRLKWTAGAGENVIDAGRGCRRARLYCVALNA
jgi:hypothetical protein